MESSFCKIRVGEKDVDICHADYIADSEVAASENLLLEEFSVQGRCAGLNAQNIWTKASLKKAWINPGGWQSWAPGYEIAPNEKRPSLYSAFIPQFTQYISVPGSGKALKNKNIILAQFISYFRIGQNYFFMVSTGSVNQENPLSPIQFEIDRKKFSVRVTAINAGKKYSHGQKIASASYFVAKDFFQAKDVLQKIFGSASSSSEDFSKRFLPYKFLGASPRGWESWYNHYTNIEESLILNTLRSLTATKNLISLEEQASPVFQIDDGWERSLGDWEWDTKKFPDSPKILTTLIEQKNFVPGLWIAPFILDYRSPVAKEHPEWILRDEKGCPVCAGFNPAWGAKKGRDQPYKSYTFFCLDLSQEEVLEYLDALMEKAINVWGFCYLKLDFLYAGMLYGKFAGGGSAFEHYDRAIKILTSRTTNSRGRSVAYLGCGMPFELSFNCLPLSRTGCDTLEHWEQKLMKAIDWNGRTSAYLNMKDSIGRAIWNRAVFLNDPDVVFARSQKCSLTKDEKILIALVAILFGSQFMTSDDPEEEAAEEDEALAEEILSLKKKYSGTEFSVTPSDAIHDVFLVESRDKKIRGALNLSERKFYFGSRVVLPHSAFINEEN